MALCQAVKRKYLATGDGKILLKCLCNLNQQDVQVEGCELTPILSPDSTNSPPTQDTEIQLKGKLLGCQDLILVQSITAALLKI